MDQKNNVSAQLGREGENLAVAYLEKNGYEIAERNWRFGKLEIDIIARKGNLLCIVEVKTRSGDYFGEPEDGVTKSKERFLATAADHYIISNNLDVEVRYDIISIVIHNGRSELKMIEDAFYPYM
ncbi:MAG: YraN family protein [Bacteroidetes bacterium]|jgi:putative endonuclease|nr:YraN family protein [Bacteroidota bacterium]